MDKERTGITLEEAERLISRYLYDDDALDYDEYDREYEEGVHYSRTGKIERIGCENTIGDMEFFSVSIQEKSYTADMYGVDIGAPDDDDRDYEYIFCISRNDDGSLTAQNTGFTPDDVLNVWLDGASFSEREDCVDITVHHDGGLICLSGKEKNIYGTLQEIRYHEDGWYTGIRSEDWDYHVTVSYDKKSGHTEAYFHIDCYSEDGEVRKVMEKICSDHDIPLGEDLSLTALSETQGMIFWGMAQVWSEYILDTEEEEAER